MIHFKVHLDKLDWCIECYITTDDSQFSEIMNRLKQLGCSSKLLDKAYNILDNQFNSGFAYSNTNIHKSIMIINKSTSMEELVNTYNHEKNHIEMHICKELGIDPYSEEAADLSGYLAQMLFYSMLNSLD